VQIWVQDRHLVTMVMIERLGTLEDVRHLAGVEPDDRDSENVANEQYIIVREANGTRHITNRVFLRVESGKLEDIDAAIEATKRPRNARTEAFLDAIDEVCRRHGMTCDDLLAALCEVKRD